MIGISVIIPLYNSEDTILQCVESLLQQDYTNLEIIIIDDGSTDNSGKICDGIVSDKVIVIHNDNRGVSHARNIGLSICKGEYIMFLDSDDWLERSACSKTAENIATQKSDIAVFNYRNVITNKFIDNEVFYTLKSEYIDNDINTIKSHLLSQDFDGNGFNAFCTPWGKLIKRSIIGNVKFDENISNHEDRIFILEILKKCRRITIINDVLYNYRVRRDKPYLETYSENFIAVAERLYGFVSNAKDVNNYQCGLESYICQGAYNYFGCGCTIVNYQLRKRKFLDLINYSKYCKALSINKYYKLKYALFLNIIKMRLYFLLPPLFQIVNMLRKVQMHCTMRSSY